MRASIAILLLLAACHEPAPPPAPPAQTGEQAWTLDGFLRYLPEEQFVTVRLPPASATGSPAVVALLETLDRKLMGATAGLADDVGAGLVLTPGGAWAHFHPASDKGLLNRMGGTWFKDLDILVQLGNSREQRVGGRDPKNHIHPSSENEISEVG